MQGKKLEKLNSVLKEIVGESVFENTIEIQNDFGIITINSVKLASDLSYLDVFVSSIKNREKLCKTLSVYAQKIKEDINKKITLRKTPIVRFRYEDEIAFTNDLLNKINSLEI